MTDNIDLYEETGAKEEIGIVDEPHH